jgi:beta-phosphoglucomutase-like phosphatase (HAD superfamily)
MVKAQVLARRNDANTAPSPPDVDALTADWCKALDAGHASVDAARLYLKPDYLAVHSQKLEQERAEVVGLLRHLAHEQHRQGSLIRWLATPRHTRAMLSLPDEIDACVFDLDGVLTTSDALHAEAWADALDPFLLAHSHPRVFVPFDCRRDYEDHLAGRPRLQGLHSFLAARGLSLPEGKPDDPPGKETVAAIAARKNQALRARLDHEGIAAFETARSYLEAASTLGIRRAVVSASLNTPEMVERAGLSHLVEACVDGRSMRAGELEGRPAPDTVLEACSLLSVPPDRTASFETTGVGVRAARAAGVALVIGVERGGDMSGCDLTTHDLGALLKPR